MAEVQSQPASVSESRPEDHAGGADKDALIIRLDEMLEKYLHTLDEYQKTREQLAKQLSSGYLSLAQANFQNRSTTHYGQDNYDERMQATRKVTVEDEAEDRLSFSIASEKEDAREVQDQNREESKDEHSEKEPASTSSENAKESKKPAKSVDPIRWFGILVPPALRSAQSSFVTAVEGSVPHLANVARELRSQEIEIGRVKKQIKKL